MNEVIYLVVSRYRVERMTKKLPDVGRGEIPVKLVLKVDENAFREPVLVKEVTVNDWRDGIDLADVEFRGNFITPEEAETIRHRRMLKMKEILETQGYKVMQPDADETPANSEPAAAEGA